MDNRLYIEIWDQVKMEYIQDNPAHTEIFDDEEEYMKEVV